MIERSRNGLKRLNEATRQSSHSDTKEKQSKRSKLPEMSAGETAEHLRGLKILSPRTFLQMLHGRWHRYAAFFLICCMALALRYYVSECHRASTVMSLNYENASKGRNPNGTRFNVSDLRAQDVMQGAIKAAGLVGQVDPEKLAACVNITPTVQRSTGSDSYYISTSYRIGINLPPEYRRLISAEDMLGLICRVFRSSFYQSHVVTTRALPIALDDITTMEYSEISDYLRLIASQTDDYLEMRLGGVSNFTAQNGDTFRALQQQLGNFVDYDLAIYDALIWERGIARDQEQETALLLARNHTLELQYKQYSLQRTMYQQIVDKYDNSMTAFVLIPSYDSNREYYMARTKTGVDEMSKAAFDSLTLAAGVQNEISLNQDRIQKLTQTVTPAWYTRADEQAAMLAQRLSDLISQICALDEEYVNSSTRNAVTFTWNKSSITRVLHLKSVLIISLLACALQYCYYVQQEKRRLKKRLKALGTGSQAAKEG